MPRTEISTSSRVTPRPNHAARDTRPHVGHEFLDKCIARLSLGLRSPLKRGLLLALVGLIILFYPAGIYAEGEAPLPTDPLAATDSTPPPTENPPPPMSGTPPTPAPVPAPTPGPAPTPPITPGPQQPPGPDGKKYAYNPKTGLWENGYYTWDPVTKQTKPKTAQQYSFNPETEHWDTTRYRYDPATNKYVPNQVKLADPSAVSPPPASGNTPAGPGYAFDLFYDASISNNVNSQANSGDASVFGNTFGGGATTGDASAMANVINVLQSTASFLGGEPITTFSSDLRQDWVGDLVIDPSVLAALQTSPMPDDANLKVTVDTNGQITNNITLDAQSGKALTSHNTSAGDATSGDANAVANIVNMMNSAISSGDAFIGTLNIYGNLDGDILLPKGVLDTLLASNTAAPTATLSSDNIENSELLAQFTDNQAIANNITAGATTGDATVANNTAAGQATTGDASTQVTVLNLTGKQIVGANSLLVFVNVLGKWVGVIMDAPVGATSAALGSGITNDQTLPTNADLTSITKGQITNNINVRAASGDAEVSNNTTGGNATTGNATASVNLLNIMNSSFSLSDWFGVLFINVFGTWNGSFGKDTSAGTATAAAPLATDTPDPEDVQVFRFEPTGHGTQRLVSTPLQGDGEVPPAEPPAVEAVSIVQSPAPEIQVESDASNLQAVAGDWVMPAIGFLAGSSLLGTERVVSSRQRRQGAARNRA